MSELPSPKWWPRIAIICIVLAAATWAAKTIRLETELLALLPKELPSVRGLDEFSRQFASDREVILVADETMPASERDAALTKLRPLLKAIHGVESVSAPGEEMLAQAPALAAWMVWNLPPDQFTKVTLALRRETVQRELAELPELLGGALDAEELALLQFDPLGLLKSLSSGALDDASQWKEQPATSLTITAGKPLIEFQDCVDFCGAVQRAVGAALPGETRLLLTGRPAFTAEISQQMRRDMMLMVGVAMALVSAAFWAFYRALKPLHWILLGQFLALGVALVGARVGVGSLNVISMGFGCILLGISMDYSILVYHHFASGFREDAASWRRLKRGIWFSAATTAAAFLVLAFASVPGMRQLAFLVACGLLSSALFATWLLPAAWILKPPKSLPFIKTSSDRVALAMDKWGLYLLIGAFVTAAWVGGPALRNPLAFYAPDLNRFQPATSAAFRGQMTLVKQDPSASDAIFLVHAGDWDNVRAAADELVARFPGSKSSPLSAMIPSPARQRENATLWPKTISSDLDAAFSDAGLGEEWTKTTMQFCAILTRAAAGEDEAFSSLSPLLSRLNRQDSAGCRTVVRIPGAADAPVPPAGLKILNAEILPVSWVALKDDLNAASSGDFQRLGGGVFAAIVVLCYLAQRSFRLLFLNIAALGMAMLLLAALLVITGTQLSALSLLCVPLLIGLVVDYSLHVLMAMEHDQGDLRKLYGHIGAPILLTGLASCIGFGAPMLTSQPALRNFGLVMDLGIISAVTSCLFLLPVLARWTQKKPSPLTSDKPLP
jgi:uncharacterized protein